MESNESVCDTCGKPATSASRDLQEIPSEGSWKEWVYRGPIRYGCDEHPARASHRYDLQGKRIQMSTVEYLAISNLVVLAKFQGDDRPFNDFIAGRFGR